MNNGIYRLTRDVKNPSPDRRRRYDWRAFETWKADTEFEVFTDKHYREFQAIRLRYGDYRTCYVMDETSPQAAELCTALKQVENDLAQIELLMTKHHLSYYHLDEVFLRLLRAGKVSVADIESAMARYAADLGDTEEI